MPPPPSPLPLLAPLFPLTPSIRKQRPSLTYEPAQQVVSPTFAPKDLEAMKTLSVASLKAHIRAYTGGPAPASLKKVGTGAHDKDALAAFLYDFLGSARIRVVG